MTPTSFTTHPNTARPVDPIWDVYPVDHCSVSRVSDPYSSYVDHLRGLGPCVYVDYCSIDDSLQNSVCDTFTIGPSS